MRGIQGGGGVANESDLVSQMSPLPTQRLQPEPPLQPKRTPLHHAFAFAFVSSQESFMVTPKEAEEVKSLASKAKSGQAPRGSEVTRGPVGGGFGGSECLVRLFL